jgi:hypothetical protein
MSVAMPRMTAVPRSGCLRSSPIITPHTSMCGTNPTVNDFTFSAFFASEKAR